MLFVDLVGFTARSDNADPEDVRATLRPYHARVKREIERFGGTVEKFVGDAVMAVFGAPVAHEDDAERAVRAALRILDAIGELNEDEELELAVRAAVATGEAVVSLGARPGEGEGIATGDVVNTAARLQGEAPVGSLVVSEDTCRATRSVIEYDELPPVLLKGKAEPVPLWRAVSARSRFGVDVDAPIAPFVGRERELHLLEGTYERMHAESEIQLVTIVGEPGAGKTRLLAEFRSWIDDRPEFVSWRQGRCLPYGEAITFWALGEIVKAHAGILESDGPDEATQKLERAIGAVDGSAWLFDRLGPLVGLAGAGESDREELFTAWQRFFETIAAGGPLVLLFEDLHWADSGTARVRRAARRALDGFATARPLHRPSRAVRATPDLGRRDAELHDRHAVAPLARGDRASRLGAARHGRATRRDAGGTPRARGRQPALRRGVRAALPRARFGR